MRIFASAGNMPTTVCTDARLRAGAVNTDQTYGQAGWDVGILFGTFQDLIVMLVTENAPAHVCGNWVSDCAPPKPGEVEALAIFAHGWPGQVDVDSRSRGSMLTTSSFDEKQCLSSWTINGGTYVPQLGVINSYLKPDGHLIFMACRAGKGKEGTEFLKLVSRWMPGRKVVGFTTMGYAATIEMQRKGKFCHEPGMRDTSAERPMADKSQEWKIYGSKWNDLNAMPWASPTSPHAKVALNGKIIKTPLE